MTQILRQLTMDNITEYAICALDSNGVVQSWNRGAQELLGYAADEIIGTSHAAFYTAASVDAGEPGRDLAIATREDGVTRQGWRVRKDGSDLFAEVSLTVTRAADGTADGFAMILRDRTEAHATEEALRQSEERVRLIVQAVRDYAILTLDPQGLVTSWNTGAEQIKGYRPEEILGQSFERFYPPEAVAAGFPQHELDVAAREGRFEDEGWRVRRDGCRFWANVVISAMHNDTGDLIGFAKITRDLTDRRNAEMQARRMAAEQAARTEAERRRGELEQLNDRLQQALAVAEAEQQRAERSAADATAAYKELDQFAYVASHDLKAPLRGIANLAQWMQDDLAEKLPDDSKEHLRLLHGRVQRMEALIEGILAYSRAGRARTEQEPVDTGALIAEVIELIAPPDGVTVDVQAGMPTLSAERIPLQQIFMNLIVNAVKHGGAYRPDLTVQVEWHDAGDAVEFTVRDDGPGIDPRFHDRVWTVFQTLASRDKVEGTGIGLSVIKKIVESRGGRVSLESATGAGAAFRFTWPKGRGQEDIR